MYITVDELCLEATRRCNMRCAHCLRGDAQDLDMSDRVIDTLLSQVDEIRAVEFNGGEPSLAVGRIRYFMEQAEDTYCFPKSFRILTNGKENQGALAKELRHWFRKMEEPCDCLAAVSLDGYHEKTGDRKERIRNLPFYSYCKEWEHARNHTAIDRDEISFPVIREGRAESFPKGKNTREPSHNIGIQIQVDSFGDNPENAEVQIDQLYVSANGKICGYGGLSYQHADEWSKYSVSDIREIVRQRVVEKIKNKEENEEWLTL